MNEEHNRVEFFDKSLEEAYFALKTSDNQLFKHITRALEDLQDNRRVGIPGPKWFIPKKYKNEGINNIWRYRLPGAWRLLYSITGDHIQVLIIILDWMTHKDYEKLVGLKRRKRR